MEYLSRNNHSPSGIEHYLIGNVDVDVCSYNFQKYVQSLIKPLTLLTLESHASHVLAMSSILLLCRNVDPCLDEYFFNATGLIKEDIFSKIGTGNNKFPKQLLCAILDIIQDVFNRKLECCLGIGKLY